MQTITHTTFENHTFKTRQQARAAKAHYKSIGQVCRLVDNGLTAGAKRWQVVVEVTKTIVKGFKRSVKPKTIKQQINESQGFSVRRSISGLSGYNVFYNGVFLFNRDKRYEAVEHAKRIGRSMHLNSEELKQLRYLK